MILKIKVLATLAFVIIATQFTAAQEDFTRKREFGVVTSSLSNFGLIYKYHFADNLKIRISTTSFRLDGSSGAQIFRAGAGVMIGYESTKKLSERLYFNRGPEVSFSVQHNYNRNNNSYTFATSPSLIYFLGLQYDLNEHFYVGGELRPSINATYSTTNLPVSTTNFGFNLDVSSSVRLNLVYVL